MLWLTQQQPSAAPHSALSHTGTSLGSNYWRTNALELQQKDRERRFPSKMLEVFISPLRLGRILPPA